MATPQDIIDSSRDFLQDADKTRWSDALLLRFFNSGQQDLVTRTVAVGATPAYVTTNIVELVAGTTQSTTVSAGTALELLDVTRNIGVSWVTSTDYVIGDIVYDVTNSGLYECLVAHTSGATRPQADSTNWVATSESKERDVEQMNEANLDVIRPNWQKAGVDHTSSEGVPLTYWIPDFQSKTRWYCYPQQPDSSYKFNVELKMVTVPADLAIDGTILLNVLYHNALINYIVYRAFAIDDDITDAGVMGKSQLAFKTYLADPIFSI